MLLAEMCEEGAIKNNIGAQTQATQKITRKDFYRQI